MKLKKYSVSEFKKVWKAGVEWQSTEVEAQADTWVNDGKLSMPITRDPWWSSLWYVAKSQESPPDIIHKPNHYITVVKGVELDCWDVQEALGMRSEHYIASAFAYLWRSLHKGNTLEDLKKARAFIDREITIREKQNV